MSFVLRQITRRTGGGGEIVRTRELAAQEPVIGRGADADIQLPDLAVSLRHAKLRRTRPGLVEVEALGGAGFTAGGEEATRAEVELSVAPVLEFGAHRLTLTREGDDVVVTVARDEAAEAAGGFDEKVFALSASVFSKRRLAWALALVVLVVGLAWPIGGYFVGREKIEGDTVWSSGSLSRAHAFLEDDCQSCHVKAFVAVRDEACMTCHEAGREPAVLQRVSATARAKGSPKAPPFIDPHAEAGRLMHGAPMPSGFGWVEAAARRAFNRPEDRCGSCHVEHGRRKDQTPALVEVNGCVDCHAGLKGRLDDTDLADVPDWGDHPDFRAVVTVSPAEPTLRRIALSANPREASGLVFPHRLHVSPREGPARMAQTLARYGAPLDCGDCHRPDQSKRGFAPVVMERDCAACHSLGYVRVGGEVRQLPHGEVEEVVATLSRWYGREPVTARPRPGELAAGRRDREAAALAALPAQAARRVREAFSEGGACVDCHRVIAPADGSLGYGIAPVHLTDRFLPRGGFDHAVPEHRKDAKGRPLCGDCHAADRSETSADLLLAPISECRDCHGRTKAQVHAPAGADCAECHSYHAPGTPARKAAIGYTARR